MISCSFIRETGSDHVYWEGLSQWKTRTRRGRRGKQRERVSVRDSQREKEIVSEKQRERGCHPVT